MNDKIQFRQEYEGRIKNPREAAIELQRIARANNGILTPEKVLENAESDRSPIHNYFTWDDSEAAKKCRLIEAGQLIRTIKVKIETHPQDPPKFVRAFVNVTHEADVEEPDSEPKNVYVPMSVALTQDAYRKQMLEKAFDELSSFRRKYAILNELNKVVEALDVVQERLALELGNCKQAA